MRLRKTKKIFVYFVVSVLGSTVAAFAYEPALAQTSMTSSHASNVQQRVVSSLPRLPQGRRTVLGGRIYEVDPVNDQFKLKIPGGQKVTIFYDARTHFFQDGAKRSVLALHPASHASIETTLDGSRIFAVSVHLLSQAPEGEVHGQVISYNPASGTLKMRSNLTDSTITLQVPQHVFIAAMGQLKSQSATTELAPGSLVEVAFQPGSHGHGIVTRIDLLAYPGARFVFQGKVSFINTNSGRLTVVDAADQNSYQITFTPQQFPAAGSLHEGSNVKVVAVFNGSSYVAQSVSTW